MTPPILVLPPRYTADSIALWKAATAAGWRVERLAGWRVPDWLRGEEIVFYGEPLLAAAVTTATAVEIREPPIQWLVDLPQPLRKREVSLMTLGEARRLRAPRFIKPAVDKCFAAGVYPSGAALPASSVLPEETPVLVAEPVVWEVEFRSFVLDRTVRTMSPYLRYGELAGAADGSWPCSDQERREAAEFAAAVLADPAVPLPWAIVLDVGRIDQRGWAVVEINAAWGSGIYGCDPAAVLEVIRHACPPKT